MIHSADQIVKRLKFEPSGSANFQNAKSLLRVQTKTADYAVLETDSGTIFTTYGDANAINFTLPANPKKGLFYIFVQAVDQNMVVTAASGTTLITHNSVVAASVDFDQGSNKIGQAVLVFADGNKFYALQLTAGTFGVNT